MTVRAIIEVCDSPAEAIEFVNESLALGFNHFYPVEDAEDCLVVACNSELTEEQVESVLDEQDPDGERIQSFDL